MNIEDRRFTKIWAGCIRLRMMDKSLKLNDFGGQGRSLIADASLFRAALFRLNHIFNQQFNLSKWPIYCDHSVTSADVRLSVGAQICDCHSGGSRDVYPLEN